MKMHFVLLIRLLRMDMCVTVLMVMKVRDSRVRETKFYYPIIGGPIGRESLIKVMGKHVDCRVLLKAGSMTIIIKLLLMKTMQTLSTRYPLKN